MLPVPLNNMNQIPNAVAQMRGGDREHTAETPAALVEARGAPHEDPRLVEIAHELQRPEQQHEQPHKRREDAEADAAREVVRPARRSTGRRSGSGPSRRG